MQLLSRDVPITLGATACLVIDVQNFCATPEGGEYAAMDPAARDREYGAFFEALDSVAMPNIARLQAACRAARVEVMFTVIENLTQDGRERSLDYKITGFNVPRGSHDAQMPEPVAPVGDEMVFPKTSSNVFVSTNIDYVMRNLGVRHLIICGVMTDQCVESAVRDACDLGYLVTLVTDACAAKTPERHANSLATIRGYCRQCTTAELIAEIEHLAAKKASA